MINPDEKINFINFVVNIHTWNKVQTKSYFFKTPCQQNGFQEALIFLKLLLVITLQSCFILLKNRNLFQETDLNKTFQYITRY